MSLDGPQRAKFYLTLAAHAAGKLHGSGFVEANIVLEVEALYYPEGTLRASVRALAGKVKADSLYAASALVAQWAQEFERLGYPVTTLIVVDDTGKPPSLPLEQDEQVGDAVARRAWGVAE